MVHKLSVGYGNLLKVYTRLEWKAKYPARQVREVHLPSSYIRLTDTGTMQCFSEDECKQVVQDIQENFIDFGFADIPYNFLIGNDGAVYRARGWYKRAQKSLTNDWINHIGLDIAYIGNFEKEDPPFEMFVTAMDLIKYGVKNNLIDPFFRLEPFKSKAQR